MKKTLIIASGVLCCAAAGLASPAHADDTVDLTVHQAPPATTSSLGMRAAPAAAPTEKPAKPESAKSAHKKKPKDVAQAKALATGIAPATMNAPVAGVDSADESEVDTRYHRFPSGWRDVQNRVIFKVNVGYDLDDASTNGANNKTGVDSTQVTDRDGNSLRTNRQFVLGDAILGTKGIVLPTLNTYLHSQYAFDLNGASDFATVPSVYDYKNFGGAVLVHSAYGELNGYGDGALKHLYLRAGRQFRYGNTQFVTNFDGATAAWTGTDWELSGFFGRRVALELNGGSGLLGGAGFKIDLTHSLGTPVSAALDYMGYQGSQHYVELATKIGIGKEGRLNLFVRGVKNGDADSFGVGRLGARLRMPISRKIFVLADLDQIFSKEAAYDFISPVPVDVVNTTGNVGLAIEPLADSTRVGGGVLLEAAPGLEAYVFGRANVIDSGSGNGFDQTWEEGGVAVTYQLPGALGGREVHARVPQAHALGRRLLPPVQHGHAVCDGEE